MHHKTLEQFHEVLDQAERAFNVDQLMHSCAIVIIITSLIRSICYMSVHPRIALLANTLKKSIDSLFHFFLIFIAIFWVFVWVALWTFGPDRADFSNYWYSTAQCLQMLTGEFPFKGSHVTTVNQQIWYLCYIFLIFLVAVSIFLAIIVEAFQHVKRNTKEILFERAFFVDIFWTIYRQLGGICWGWPSHQSLKSHLEMMQDDPMPVTSMELTHSRFLKFKKLDILRDRDVRARQEEARRLMDFYLRVVGHRILVSTGKRWLDALKEESEFRGRMEKFFRMPPGAFVTLVTSAIKVQRAYRRYARKPPKTLPANRSVRAQKPPSLVAMRTGLTVRQNFRTGTMSSQLDRQEFRTGTMSLRLGHERSGDCSPGLQVKGHGVPCAQHKGDESVEMPDAGPNGADCNSCSSLEDFHAV